MSDPKRWSEGGAEHEVETSLVVAGQQRRLPDAERRALWAALALSLPPLPLAAAPLVGSATARVSLLSAKLTQGALLLVVSLGLGAAALRWLPQTETKATLAASHVDSRPAFAPPQAPAPTPRLAESAPTAEPSARSIASAETKPRSTASSQLREEAALVLQARAALRAGQAGESLRLLSQAQARFPRGALAQEREALGIEALAKTGQLASARRRAAAFLELHPQSPYASDVRRSASP